MAKTFKGWTRIDRKDAPKYGKYFTFWHKEGFQDIVDFCDGSPKGWCNPQDRYDVGFTRSFYKLSDAIRYAETGKMPWEF